MTNTIKISIGVIKGSAGVAVTVTVPEKARWYPLKLDGASGNVT